MNFAPGTIPMSAEVKFHDALRTRTFVEYVLVRLANVPKADCEGFLTVMRNEMYQACL